MSQDNHFVCGICFGTSIMIARWVDPNTNEIMPHEEFEDIIFSYESLTTLTWCEDCKEYVELIEQRIQ